MDAVRKIVGIVVRIQVTVVSGDQREASIDDFLDLPPMGIGAARLVGRSMISHTDPVIGPQPGVRELNFGVGMNRLVAKKIKPQKTRDGITPAVGNVHQ